MVAGKVFFLVLATLLAPSAALGAGEVVPGDTFEFGDFALYLPAEPSKLRGVLLALGGPDTRAFVSDGSFDAPKPELEASLHLLGRDLRTLAGDRGLAILGTSRHGQDAIPNRPGSDRLILDAIDQAAGISSRPELARAPIFVYGISGGSLQAAGFVARNPARVGALLLKVPGPPQRLSDPAALAVPTYLILAGEDAIADNRAVLAAFESNRRAGGLWAAAPEPGVPHHSLTPGHRALTVNWLRAVVGRRLGPTGQEPLHEIPESSGWLGNPELGVADWTAYPGDRDAASWFPDRSTAEEWWQFTVGKGAP